MSQKQIHRANRKTRKQIKQVVPAIVWYNVTRARIKRFPWNVFDAVFPLYPRPSRIRRAVKAVVRFAFDIREWVTVVFARKEVRNG